MTCATRILAVSGSLGANSKNYQLLLRAIARVPAGVTIELAPSVGRLPHFDPDLEARGTLAAVEAWRRALRRSDAVLIACPEYGHSLPGSLKNAIDWVIGSGELSGKTVAITAATTSSDRGLRGLDALATTLRALGCPIVGGVPTVASATSDDEIAALVRALVAASTDRRAA